jgi:hypothetical protein
MNLATAKALAQGEYIHHVSVKNADGTPARARITLIKIWKREPDRIELHYKRGMREYGEITYPHTFGNSLDEFEPGYGDEGSV